MEGVQKTSRRELILEEQCLPEEATRSVVGAAERAWVSKEGNRANDTCAVIENLWEDGMEKGKRR